MRPLLFKVVLEWNANQVAVMVRSSGDNANVYGPMGGVHLLCWAVDEKIAEEVKEVAELEIAIRPSQREYVHSPGSLLDLLRRVVRYGETEVQFQGVDRSDLGKHHQVVYRSLPDDPPPVRAPDQPPADLEF